MNNEFIKLMEFYREYDKPFVLEKIIYNSSTVIRLAGRIKQLIGIIFDENDEMVLELCKMLRIFLWRVNLAPLSGEEILEINPFNNQSYDEIIKLYGKDAFQAYSEITDAVQEFAESENPLRKQYRSILGEIINRKLTFRIICNHFDSMYYLNSSKDIVDLNHESVLISSPSKYNDLDPFDVLIKIGPFRHEGMASAPQSIFLAPRQKEIIQIVWQKMRDDDDFRIHPVTANIPDRVLQKSGLENQWPQWVIKEFRSDNEDNNQDDSLYLDDLFLTQKKSEEAKQKDSILICFHNEKGMLLGNRRSVIGGIVDNIDKSCKWMELQSDNLAEGMLICIPQLHEIGLEEYQEKHGRICEIWKNALLQELQASKEDLIERLRKSGMKLKTISSRVEEWCDKCSNVIKAPKEYDNFRLLIHVLMPKYIEGRDEIERISRMGWIEIRKSRGEAILEGKRSKEELQKLVIGFLGKMNEHDYEKIIANGEIILQPSETMEEMEGEITIYGIKYIEDGYLAPETELERIQPLNDLLKWKKI